METRASVETVYGLLAEFDNPDDLVGAVRQTRAAGYRKLDAYSPMPVHGLDEALGVRRTRLPFLVLACGLVGAGVGLALQYYVTSVSYPTNVGGRPLFSWPAFVPVTFELGVLYAAFGAAFGMLLANGLPRPYHPLFNVPGFARASQDRFFLCVEAEDPRFDLEATRRFLESLNPCEVSPVEP